MWTGLINKYREYLPVSDKTPVITLNEGNTQLIKAEKLSKELNVDLYLKFEGGNPTGSFKDRGMTMAISKAVEAGSRAVMCASTGNTSASAAAYAARAGIQCAVLIPDGNIALGKLAQAMMHGAKVFALQGNFDDALRMVQEICGNYPITLVNSVNPYRIEGQKTGAFEIIEQLGFVPDFHAIPVGNAGNITAYWKGYKEYKAIGKTNKLPIMIGFQASGSAPIVEGRVIEKPHTIATAIKIGNPASWKQAEAARDESGGSISPVTDEEITIAQQLIASQEGVFCEPASAAPVAGVIKLRKEGKLPSGVSIVAILTGHGLKDPDRAIAISAQPIKVEANKETILKLLGLS
ncbi:MAG: threonine synthase [Candidatus Margulisiibacteriota bacterium]|jgi:threonine synthase